MKIVYESISGAVRRHLQEAAAVGRRIQHIELNKRECDSLNAEEGMCFFSPLASQQGKVLGTLCGVQVIYMPEAWEV